MGKLSHEKKTHQKHFSDILDMFLKNFSIATKMVVRSVLIEREEHMKNMNVVAVHPHLVFHPWQDSLLKMAYQ